VNLNRVIIGDCRETLRTIDAGAVQCCVTSPPYWGLRDYGCDGQIGLEQSPAEYVEKLVAVFREVRRVLADDGTLWLNIGDKYANDAKWGGRSGGIMRKSLHGATGVGRRKVTTGLKPKDLIGLPWMVAFALRSDGWFLRDDIVWHKPTPMPESVDDRPTRAHEFVFLFAKSERYFYDGAAIRERATYGNHRRRDTAAVPSAMPDARPHKGLRLAAGVEAGRNARDVWTIQAEPFAGAHFATMPPALVSKCISAGSRIGDTVLDPFMGSGTVGMVAQSLGRHWLGCELNPKYESLIKARTAQTGLLAGCAE
jgi:DNA modification methylase